MKKYIKSILLIIFSVNVNAYTLGSNIIEECKEKIEIKLKQDIKESGLKEDELSYHDLKNCIVINENLDCINITYPVVIFKGNDNLGFSNSSYRCKIAEDIKSIEGRSKVIYLYKIKEWKKI